MARFSAVSMCSSFIRVTDLVNGAQFLNAALVFKSPPVAFVPAVTRIYASVCLFYIWSIIKTNQQQLQHFVKI